jgi:hypothetical protein
MSVTKVDFTKKKSEEKEVFIVISESNNVLMTIDMESIQYDTIHKEYLNVISYMAKKATDSIENYFDFINDKLTGFMKGTLYKVRLSNDEYKTIIESEAMSDFSSWERFTVPFYCKDIQHDTIYKSQQINALQMF